MAKMSEYESVGPYAGRGPEAENSVYGRFQAHFSALRGESEVVLTHAIRQLHPDKHITSLPCWTADLQEFADAGKAQTRLVKDHDQYLARRHYEPPVGRMNGLEGKLGEDVRFGLHEYSYAGDDFLVYVINYPDADLQGTSTMQFILTPLADVDASFNSPAADRLVCAAGKYSSQLHNEVYVFDGGYWEKNPSLWKAVQSAHWDDVILDPATKDAIIRDVNTFFDSRDIYQEYSVPWKRGIIFHGTPGCGKTISIKALMNSLQKRDVASLYVKSFKSCSGPQSSIRSIFSQAREMAPCMLVFEDLDSLVVDSVRSYFLNEIDGIESNDGILIIGSTNHLNRLDPGIAKRPSRFDRKYHYSLPGSRERLLYCGYWRTKLQRNPSIIFPEEICPLVAEFTEGFSYAYLKELFVQSLLASASGRIYDQPPENRDDEDEDMNNGSKDDEDDDVKNDDDDDDDDDDDADGTEDSSPSGKSGKKKSRKSGKKKARKLGKKKRSKNSRPKIQMPEVEIPEHLRDNAFLGILHRQARALYRDMDNSGDGEDGDDIHSRTKVIGNDA